jgi:polyphosphate glucokinase
VPTPKPLTPTLLVDTLAELVKPLPPFQRISVGFPGLIRNGIVATAPNLGTDVFHGFDLGKALTAKLGAPTRCLNDADMQGLGAISGKGVEMVITLGTGFGTSTFQDGKVQLHLELAHHPFRKGKTYEQCLGDAALADSGKKKWSKRVEEAISCLRTLVFFDHLYIGGGNARHIKFDLPSDITVVDNSAGITGGIRLWDDQNDA